MGSDILYRLVRGVLFLFCKVFFKIRIEGAQNLPLQGGVILAANHTSYLDIPCTAVALSRRVYFVARQELFRSLPLTVVMNLFQTIPITRGETDISSIKSSLEHLKKGDVICLFPEGTRSLDGRISKPAGAGIGFLAVKSGVPVVPLCIRGTYQALPKGSHWIHPYPVRISFGEPIYPQKATREHLGKEQYHQVTALVMQSLQVLQEKLWRT